MIPSPRCATLLQSLALLLATGICMAQNPYPNAATDRGMHAKRPMLPPARNAVFQDPDFLSTMVRATDETTDFTHPGGFLQTEGSGQENEWSADGQKFWVGAMGGRVYAYAFDPASMTVSSLPQAAAGQALLLPLRPEPNFSFVNPNILYGTTNAAPLTIASYDFSTGTTTPVIDTTTCGVKPALAAGALSDDDVTSSLNDRRVAISEGAKQFGQHMFVVVYDKKLGCRWLNTQTGQIGGKWGPSGHVVGAGASFRIRHSYLSKSGRYVRIMGQGLTEPRLNGWYVWDVATLNLTNCGQHTSEECLGYGVVGYNSFVNGPAVIDDLEVVKRPLNNLSQFTELIWPLNPPHYWENTRHFTWSNVDVKDSTPVCGSTYNYDGDMTINEPFEGEIFCVETDGLASTTWRFAHNRAAWIAPWYNTQPLGAISRDGHFFLFTSGWDAQLGWSYNRPRTDVWIVKLE